MSEWYKIEDEEFVEVSKDKKTIEVLFNTNENGNQYIDIPIEFIKNVLNEG